jgi:hypothetical protein
MDQTHAKAEAMIGGALMTTPAWAVILNDVNIVASAVAAICGAVIGIHAVWRLWKRHRAARA